MLLSNMDAKLLHRNTAFKPYTTNNRVQVVLAKKSLSCLVSSPRASCFSSATYLGISVASIISVSKRSHLTNTNIHRPKVWSLEQKLPTEHIFTI